MEVSTQRSPRTAAILLPLPRCSEISRAGRYGRVAVFDTAFFHDLPAHAAHYALPAELVARFGIRRFGFHGISHQYVCRQASARLGLPDRPARLISLHLGSGSSIAAVRGERCVDTSMGMTPLEGLVMDIRAAAQSFESAFMV